MMLTKKQNNKIFNDSFIFKGDFSTEKVVRKAMSLKEQAVIEEIINKIDSSLKETSKLYDDNIESHRNVMRPYRLFASAIKGSIKQKQENKN